MLDAEPILEVEPSRDPLGAQPLPAERRITLAGLKRSSPGRPAGLDILYLGDIHALHRQHGIDDRLPGSRAQKDGLALQVLEVAAAFPFPEGEAEGISRAHVEDGLQGHTVLDG